VQFNMLVKREDKAHKYDCASCRGKNHKCLLHKKSVRVIMPELNRPLILNKDNWSRLSDAWQRQHKGNLAPDWYLLNLAGVCPMPLITDFSHTAFSMFDAVGVGKFNSPKDYCNASAFWVSTAGVISNVISECQQFLREESSNG
jgi:hypothetical protein